MSLCLFLLLGFIWTNWLLHDKGNSQYSLGTNSLHRAELKEHKRGVDVSSSMKGQGKRKRKEKYQQQWQSLIFFIFIDLPSFSGVELSQSREVKTSNQILMITNEPNWKTHGIALSPSLYLLNAHLPPSFSYNLVASAKIWVFCFFVFSLVSFFILISFHSASLNLVVAIRLLLKSAWPISYVHC